MITQCDVCCEGNRQEVKTEIKKGELASGREDMEGFFLKRHGD